MLKGYGAVILDGAWLTLQLALSSMALAIVLGLIGVALRLSPVRWLAWLGDLYSTVIRGIPDLVLILLIFYGGQDLLNRVAPLLGFDDYIDLNPLAAGIGTLGFIFGAYLSETFRGAFMAIPKGQAEAGAAYGMSGMGSGGSNALWSSSNSVGISRLGAIPWIRDRGFVVLANFRLSVDFTIDTLCLRLMPSQIVWVLYGQASRAISMG